MKHSKKTAALIVALGMFAPGLALAQLQGGCNVRSGNLGGPSSVTFTYPNAFASEEDSFKVYYANEQGALLEMFTLFPGQAMSMSDNVRANTAWVVKMPIPGDGELCLGHYFTRQGHTTVTFGD